MKSELVEKSLWGVPMKYVALLLLVGQTVAVIVTLRYSRLVLGQDGKKYLNTTAVVMSEIVKLIASFLLLIYDTGSVRACCREIDKEVVQQPDVTFKVGVPAFLYTIQNNLLFVALSFLPGAIYQPTYQLKILTTAVLSVLLLGRSLGRQKWCSLLVLSVGVAAIQIPDDSSTKPSENINLFWGLLSVLAACVTSGFAGVYFEMILKEAKTSIWLRNIQLALFGILLGLLGCLWSDGEMIANGGFFQGYTAMTWSAIMLMSAGGLIVAMVLKYADNILKCFGNAIAICISCVASYYMGDFVPNVYFAVGCAAVILATYLYAVDDALSTFKLPLGMSVKRKTATV